MQQFMRKRRLDIVFVYTYCSSEQLKKVRSVKYLRTFWLMKKLNKWQTVKRKIKIDYRRDIYRDYFMLPGKDVLDNVSY